MDDVRARLADLGMNPIGKGSPDELHASSSPRSCAGARSSKQPALPDRSKFGIVHEADETAEGMRRGRGAERLLAFVIAMSLIARCARRMIIQIAPSPSWRRRRPAASTACSRGSSPTSWNSGSASTFIVENRPGAASIVGAAYVAHAAPDGYTLMVGEQHGDGDQRHHAQDPALRSGRRILRRSC